MATPGDVYEINIDGRYAYFQYTYKHRLMGYLIRVLPGLYEYKPADLNDVVNMEPNFWVFFFLNSAISRHEARKVGRFPVPDHAREFPLFRCPVRDFQTDAILGWWLWNGEKEWPLSTALTPNQLKLPIRQLWDATGLARHIREGWLPESVS